MALSLLGASDKGIKLSFFSNLNESFPKLA